LSRQKLGQHFLADQSVLQRIAEAVCAKGEPLMVEIGPGKGALTQYLLSRAKHVAAVEIDPELAQYLTQRFPALEVVRGDAMKVDFGKWPGAPIAGNLPYYVATPIISRVVRLGRPSVFLIQKEVAERITATPGGREYGYFSVEVQLFAEARLLFTVKPDAFRPPPKVESAVIELVPRVAFPELASEAFLKFVSRAFLQKRKTLRNNLGSLFPKELLDAQPEGSMRAEQLSIAQFADLYKRLSAG
jgi:16S rRNA (adenine1518-N6/adenine1519-N6)-dimethyltransferase